MDEKLSSLLSQVLKVDPSRLGKDIIFSDLETWNSLCQMELIVGLEETFNMQLELDEIAEMTSVEAVRNIVINHKVG